jgi:hypothetical protein
VAEQRLRNLRDAGVTIGAGDIRSVIRGHVLATYTSAPRTGDLDALAALADELAANRITQILATAR